jgi:serine beta-lactamase-like protein LACTB, mitochondrial
MRIILTICGLVAALAALPTYMWATGTPLHAAPQSVPSLTRSQPSAQWASAVTRARHAMRAGVAEQNLPGASVAVGVGGDIVWAEGFGWADLETLRPVTPDTRFRIGTASKLLTSAGVDVLTKQGRLTQRQVASLSTAREDEQWSRQRCEHPLDPVSAAVESAARQPFFTFMREQVFQPLGMKQTDAESAAKENPEDIGGPGEDPPPFTAIHDLILRPLGMDGNSVPATVGKRLNLATIYAPGWGQHPVLRYHLHVMQPRNLSCYAGSMAFFSTPSDLVRLAVAMNATAKELDGDLHGARVVSLMTLRDRGIVVTVTANGSYANTSALAQQVADAFK